MNPYRDDKRNENQFIRVFEENVDDEELIWHRDRRNRVIKVLSGNDWKLQYDNELPFVMKMNEIYEIEAEQYHRVIKGKDKLVLEIREE